MKDPMRGQYTQTRYFRREFLAAKIRLAPMSGVVTPGEHDYQAFVFSMPGLRLVFYPHKTSAGNAHIRVRTEGKFNQKLLNRAISLLAENSCTFQFPQHSERHQKAISPGIKTVDQYSVQELERKCAELGK